MDITHIGDELYLLPPQEFTAARDTRVAALRNAGEKSAAADVAALKRPTVGAWLVNALTLSRPAALTALLEAGAEIRAGQGSDPNGGGVRALSERRRRELATAMAAIRQLAAAASMAPTRAQLDEAESTLSAALADPDAAALVAGGRLLKPLSYGGFGGFSGLGGAVNLGGGGAGRSTATPTAGGRGQAADSAGGHGTTAAGGQGATAAGGRGRASADGDAAAAERAADRAAALDAATDRVTQATQRLAQAIATEQAALASIAGINEEIARLKDALDVAEREARAGRQERLAAEKDAAMARRRLDRMVDQGP